MKEPKVMLSIRMEKDILGRVDGLAHKATDGNRSQLIENLVSVALMDAELMKKVGLLDIAKALQKLNCLKGRGYL